MKEPGLRQRNKGGIRRSSGEVTQRLIETEPCKENWKDREIGKHRIEDMKEQRERSEGMGGRDKQDADRAGE